jgi:malonyl-CoA/methylmalonyl-CoA synthetase
MPAGDVPDLAPGGTLPGSWAARWAARPAWPQLQDTDGRWLSSLELEARSRAAAARLRGLGLAPGDRVVVSAAPSAALVIAHIGALRAGLVVVPVNGAYTEREVALIGADADPRAAIVDDPRRAAWLGPAVLALDPALTGLPEPDQGPLDRARPEDVALLVYTSGTTGRPKGARLTHANLLAGAASVGLAWRWEEGDRLLLTLPLFHIHGLGVGLHGTLTAGAAVTLRPGFDVADVAARAGAATLFFGVPAIYQRLVTAGAASALRGLRLCVSGSAPLPAALAEAVAAATGAVPLERYGMTETMMLTSNPYSGERRPGTVGLPLPGVDLRLAADGEIQVRGPNVMPGYWRRPDADADAFTADGWFRTGDLGEHDDAGYLRIAGRSKDLIITGGFNVHPREVEEALLSHPAVREVAVVGRPSESWGEEVTAIVIADPPVPAEALRAHAAGLLAPYKVPKRFEFARTLPRNALGKLLRGELR